MVAWLKNIFDNIIKCKISKLSYWAISSLSAVLLFRISQWKLCVSQCYIFSAVNVTIVFLTIVFSSLSVNTIHLECNPPKSQKCCMLPSLTHSWGHQCVTWLKAQTELQHLYTEAKKQKQLKGVMFKQSNSWWPQGPAAAVCFYLTLSDQLVSASGTGRILYLN